MANKEIFNVEIDDSALGDLKQRYDEYSAALSKMPGEWREASTEIKAQTSKFERMYAGLEEQNRVLLDTSASEEKFNIALDTAAVSWIGMLKTGKLFAGHIVHSTHSLLRWTKLTAVFSGILGAGGLFGINRMAANVANQRTSATGLGVSYGEQASFLANFGRIPGAEGILSGFAEAETQVSDKWRLQQWLGHDPSGNPARDFADGLKKFKTFVDQYKGDRQKALGPSLEARGYDKLGITTESALAVQGMSGAEVEQLGGGYQADLAGRLGLSDADAKKWTELTQQMEAAGYQIEDVFARRVVGLTKPLENLSNAFVNFTARLLEDTQIKEWIGDLGRGVKNFAEMLGSGVAQAKAAQIGRDVNDSVKLIESLLAKAPDIASLTGIALAARYGGSTAAAIGAGLGRSGVVGALGRATGVVLGPVGTVAAGGLAATAGPTNESIPELERQRRYNQGRPQSRPLDGREDERARQKHEVGGQELARGPATQREQSEKPWETPWNREMRPAHAVDLAETQTGGRIDDADVQTYLRTGGHPDPQKAAWCAMFVGASLTQAGIKDSGSNVATSYAGWGKGVDPRHVQKGDVYVRTRGHRPGEVGGHVGMLTGESRFVHGHEQVQMISGNSAHQVRETWEPVGGTNVIRRATDTGAPRHAGQQYILGHHPATIGKVSPPVSIMDNTGGQVSIAQ
jgi:cell wall-associated NlpC family hydrolase